MWLAPIAAALAVGPLQSCGEQASGERAVAGGAAGATETQSQHNAAEEYRSLFNSISPTLAGQLSASRGQLSPALEGSLPGARAIRDRLVWAATQVDRCDWGIDYSDAMELELPHLGELRTLTRLLTADAALAAKEGDTRRAAENTAAVVGMSRHVGGEYGIEALVAGAVMSTGAELAREHAASWDASERRMVLDQLREIDEVDPFDLEGKFQRTAELAEQENLPPPDTSMVIDTRTRTVDTLNRAIAALER